jgi:polyisoprenoid-binding protein YceI
MKSALSRLFLGSCCALASSLFAAPETYVIDPAHSSVGFNIRHAFSKVPGSFTQFTGTIVYDAEKPEASSTEAKIEVGSINTNNTKRDDHLRNPDYFTAEKFPAITFKSKSWKKTGDATFDVTGDLTIKDVTKEVVLKTTLLGIGPGMRGSTISGWEGTTRIDRRDFGITSGAPVVGNEVDVVINVEAVKK